jgi:hypothetical protein
MQTTISQATADKAAKIIGESRIEWVKGHVYRVQGDSGTYTVHVSYPQEVTGQCDCPAKGVCSHLIAACAYELAHPPVQSAIADPFDF